MGANVLYLPVLLFMISMMVVGGLGRPWGPILGAALVMLADEGMKDFVEIRNMGYGALIVAIVVLLPQGAAGGLEQIWIWLRRQVRLLRGGSDDAGGARARVGRRE